MFSNYIELRCSLKIIGSQLETIIRVHKTQFQQVYDTN